jgi:hypothetical protein
MTEETYLFHQTPESLAIELLKEIDILETDIVLEPFKGEGAFYNNFPACKKEWCEITQDRDWLSYTDKVDWVISNPPFRLDNGVKRENAFYKILFHYSTLVNKGIAFLGNDYCLASLTPKRLNKLKENGLYLHNIVVCSVKKWRGRYFFMIFKKEESSIFKGIEGSF